MLSEETPTNKVILSVAAGTLVLFGAFLLCVLVRSDPLGGMRFTPHSLAAGVIGLIGGLPLVVFRVALWSEYMRARVSVREKEERGRFWALLCALFLAFTLDRRLPGIVIVWIGRLVHCAQYSGLFCRGFLTVSKP